MHESPNLVGTRTLNQKEVLGPPVKPPKIAILQRFVFQTGVSSPQGQNATSEPARPLNEPFGFSKFQLTNLSINIKKLSVDLTLIDPPVSWFDVSVSGPLTRAELEEKRFPLKKAGR